MLGSCDEHSEHKMKKKKRRKNSNENEESLKKKCKQTSLHLDESNGINDETCKKKKKKEKRDPEISVRTSEAEMCTDAELHFNHLDSVLDDMRSCLDSMPANQTLNMDKSSKAKLKKKKHRIEEHNSYEGKEFHPHGSDILIDSVKKKKKNKCKDNDRLNEDNIQNNDLELELSANVLDNLIDVVKKKKKKKCKDELNINVINQDKVQSENLQEEVECNQSENLAQKAKKKKKKKHTDEENINERLLQQQIRNHILEREVQCNTIDSLISTAKEKKKRKHTNESIERDQDIIQHDHSKQNRLADALDSLIEKKKKKQKNGNINEPLGEDNENKNEEKIAKVHQNTKLNIKTSKKISPQKGKHSYKSKEFCSSDEDESSCSAKREQKTTHRDSSALQEISNMKPEHFLEQSLTEDLSDIDDIDFYAEHRNSNTTHNSSIDLELLKHLSVSIPFELPLLHKIVTRVTNTPMKTQQEKIEELKLPVKKGKYSPVEDDILKANWQKFCKVHDFPPNPELFLNIMREDCKKPILPLNERLKFVQFLAHGLPDRMLFSVYKRFQILYTEVNRGRFSKEEDELIMSTVQSTKNAKHIFARLGRELNRDRSSIEKHYAWLRDSGLYEKAIRPKKFTIDCGQGAKLVAALIETMNVKDVSELKNRQIPINMFYDVAEELRIRPISLQQYWHVSLHPKLFVTGTRDMAEVKRKLLDLVEADTEAISMNTIRYSKYLRSMDGWTSLALNKILKNTLQYANPNIGFRESLLLARHNSRNDMRTLPTAEYHDGKMTIY